MGRWQWLNRWPAIRQLRDGDPLTLGAAASSPRMRALEPRATVADKVVRSVRPDWAVGCGQVLRQGRPGRAAAPATLVGGRAAGPDQGSADGTG